jgi:Uma2 family endonuclease
MRDGMSFNVNSTGHYWTLDEYYALEKASERRYEYWAGEIVCMSGGSKEHGIIQSNLSVAFGSRLKRPCRPFGADTAIKAPIASGYVYPDASVACDPHFIKHPQGIDILTNPVVIIEVTSATSGIRDHDDKRDAYQTIETLKDYLIIEPDSIFVTQYLRSAEGWKKRIYDNAEDLVALTGADMTLTLGEIYQDVTTEPARVKD